MTPPKSKRRLDHSIGHVQRNNGPITNLGLSVTLYRCPEGGWASHRHTHRVRHSWLKSMLRGGGPLVFDI